MSGYDKSVLFLNVIEKVSGFVDVFHPYLEIHLLFSFRYKKGGGEGGVLINIELHQIGTKVQSDHDPAGPTSISRHSLDGDRPDLVCSC